MRLLLVEDNDEVFEDLAVRLADYVDLSRVQSRDEAYAALDAEQFDLVVVDLSIPPAPASSDEHTDHGVAVFKMSRARQPGVPVVIYSAYGQSIIDELGDLLATEPDAEYLGDGPRSMALHRSKGRLSDLVREIKEHAAAVEELESSAELSWVGSPLDLDELERRVLLIHARRYGARVVRLRALTGGRSDARTLHIELAGSADDNLGAFIAKLNSIAGVLDEVSRYNRWIRPYLHAGSYANFVEAQLAGAGDRAAVFYAVAPGSAPSLLDLVFQDPVASRSVVTQLRESLRGWEDATEARERTVRDIRRDLLSDERCGREADELDQELPLSAAESISVAARFGPIHGDFHGGNVLVTPNGVPIVIDFGSAASGARVNDVVALELSYLLHADAPVPGAWPTIEQAKSWCELDAYLRNCPCEDFVSACRSWSNAVKRADREELAAVYAYARQQMTFPSIREGRRLEIARALATGAIERLTGAD